MGLGLAAAFVVSGSLPIASAEARTRTLLNDNMSDYALGTCYAEGQTFGNFQDLFNGYGSACILPGGGKSHVLDLQPQASASPSAAHAALTTTTASFGGGYTLTVNSLTVRQLRTGSPPNPWEVGWVLWNYSGNNHFYNVILKPNGWEVDKEYSSNGIQAQQFLASGTSPAFPVGSPEQVVVIQSVSSGVPTFVVRATVGGTLQTLATVTDPGTSVSGPAYTSGHAGLYAEDSEAQFGLVRVTSP
jgi:hypothetical protein